jgi:multidrug efflux pump subunit AcrA (membrane-fusion protein)
LGVIVIAAASIGAFMLLTGPGGSLAATVLAQTPTETPTVAIRAADSMVGQISASGSIAPVDIEHVVLAVDGTVREVSVKAGDAVAAGAPLLRLDTSDLELSVLLAELDVATAQNSLAQLQEPASVTELAEARADLDIGAAAAGRCAQSRRRRLNSLRRAPASLPPGPNVQRSQGRRQAPPS